MNQPSFFKTGILISISTFVLTLGSPLANLHSQLDTITGEKVLAAKKHGTISVGVLGSILNVAIGTILGGVGGVGGGVAMAIKQKGKTLVRNILKSRLKATLAGAGIGGATALLGKAVDFALDYSNPGGVMAKFFDSHDKIKNNVYLEFW